MALTTFEIRQQAEEILRETVKIWQQSNQSEYLDGIENDPVFSLLITALTYQLNDIDYDIEHIKEDILDEYANMQLPYYLMHASPATAVIRTAPIAGLPQVLLDDTTPFALGEFSFMPLLRTRVIGTEISSITRLDGRRWKVKLHFNFPIDDISYFSFAIDNDDFKDVYITVNKRPLPIVKPWHYADLPLSQSFDIDTVIYNSAATLNASNIWLDLFARQNARLFCIKKLPANFIHESTEDLEFIFEFKEIGEHFVFNSDTLILNTALLINASRHTADLSSQAPIARVTGYNSNSNNSEQFVHLLRPSDDMIYANAKVNVRTIAGDRFNQARMLKLVNALINKFNSDFYAFLHIKNNTYEPSVRLLREGLKQLKKACEETPDKNIIGTYLTLSSADYTHNKDIQLQIPYVTTNGSFVNASLTEESRFSVPVGLEYDSTHQIMPPTPGTNEVTDPRQQASIARYNVVTSDRIVTIADMKSFCRNELMTRYSITDNMIEAININTRLAEDLHRFGYETWVDITIHDSAYIRKYFTEKIPQAELFLKKMMEVRSTSVYPIQVNIRIGDTVIK